MTAHPASSAYVGPIIRDPVDTRDLLYRPTLGLLPDQILGAAMDPRNDAYRKNLSIRQQGSAPSCIGESLAALVDIQRIETYAKAGDVNGAQAAVWPASGAMLYAMAIEIESNDLGRQATEIYSLRSGLKGFYNTGVCTEARWPKPSDAKEPARFDDATVAAMTEARNVTLGAYFRVQSVINDYHAALLEAGALYVSAELHDGWETPVKGVITPGHDSNAQRGGHAFVIVGYERRGFLVLNSWGVNWGGYAFGDGPPMPGIALWTYEDWAACVIDAWVLRLAAPTPESFQFTVGPQGTAQFGGDQGGLAAASVRRLVVLGHYIHLDDGRHVISGSYPSSRKSLETTLDHLASDARSGVTDLRLTIHGDVMPTHDVLSRIARTLAADRAASVHGLSLLWVNGLLSGASEALHPLFDTALSVTKGDRRAADDRIERMTRPVGRALWRDARRAAEIAAAAKEQGDAAHALARIVHLCATGGKRLNIVSEGAGILLLAALLGQEEDRAEREAALADVLWSLTIVAPLIPRKDFDPTVGGFLEEWFRRTQRRATIFRANEAMDQRLAVGSYSRSWTDLVSRAFEDRPVRNQSGRYKPVGDQPGRGRRVRDLPVPLVGSHDFRGPLRGKPAVTGLAPPARPEGNLSTTSVLQHEAVAAHLEDEIAKAQGRQPATTKSTRRKLR